MHYQIDFTPTIDDKQLRKEGAYLSAVYTALGCTLFMLTELLPHMLEDLSSVPDILSLIMLSIYLCLFSLPFSISGGYVLTWLLQKAQWYRHSKTKVIVSGILIASITMLVMLLAGGYLTSCLVSHGQCGMDYTLLLKGLFRGTILIKTFLIAAACGARIAWQLSRLAQQETA